ncbi:MAG: hypothetical protein KY397_00025 [Gemmatimonadetes bacterium]|nr:hypothetical protein [Gemmatimonadota bacterium]
MTPPLVLVDPHRESFWPLAAARPVADLLAGTMTFRARWAEVVGGVASLWCDESVTGCAFRSGDRPVLNRWPDPGQGLLVALSSWVPPAELDLGEDPAEWRLDDAPVAWRLDGGAAAELAGEGPGSPRELVERLAGLGLPVRSVEGLFLDAIWSVMAANPGLIERDAVGFAGVDSVAAVDPLVLLGDDDDLKVGPDVTVGPFVVLDVREGPIVLDSGARVASHARLRGPLYVGRESVVLGGEVGGGASIGPRCKVRGEIEQTILQGFANKAHDGFVGHSVLGEWTNLGADTVTSDLKNTYGSVRVEAAEGRIDTGLLKVGAFLGDHVKTGIGTLLTTGARIGAGSHVFGGRAVSPPRLPEFSWFDGSDRVPVRWEPFERAASTAMDRRDQSLGEGEREMLRSLHGVGR